MASYSVARSKHATLSTTVVDTVTLSDFGQLVEVVNDDGTNALWVTVDGTTPVASADNTHRVPANGRKLIDVGAPGRTGVAVKVLGNGGAYHVELDAQTL